MNCRPGPLALFSTLIASLNPDCNRALAAEATRNRPSQIPVQEYYNRFAQTAGPADAMRISREPACFEPRALRTESAQRQSWHVSIDFLPGSYDAARALTWLGYRATHEEHQLTFSKVPSHGCPSLFAWLRGPACVLVLLCRHRCPGRRRQRGQHQPC